MSHKWGNTSSSDVQIPMYIWDIDNALRWARIRAGDRAAF